MATRHRIAVPGTENVALDTSDAVVPVPAIIVPVPVAAVVTTAAVPDNAGNA